MTMSLFPYVMFLFMLWILQPLNLTEKEKSFDLAKCWQMIKWKDKVKMEKRTDTGEDYERSSKWKQILLSTDLFEKPMSTRNRMT